MKNYNIFHIFLLQPASNLNLALFGQWNNPSLSIEIEDEQEYLINQIKDFWYNYYICQYKYLVKWTNYDELIWKSYKFVWQATTLTNFHNCYPNQFWLDDYNKKT